MAKKTALVVGQPIITKTIDITPIQYSNLLSFQREPGNRQVLCVKMWYVDGSTDELIITSPHVMLGNDIETQYIYIQRYLQKMCGDLGIVAYQASISHIVKGELRLSSISWAKVDCSSLRPFGPGQYWDVEAKKGGVKDGQ